MDSEANKYQRGEQILFGIDQNPLQTEDERTKFFADLSELHNLGITQIPEVGEHFRKLRQSPKFAAKYLLVREDLLKRVTEIAKAGSRDQEEEFRMHLVTARLLGLDQIEGAKEHLEKMEIKFEEAISKTDIEGDKDKEIDTFRGGDKVEHQESKLSVSISTATEKKGGEDHNEDDFFVSEEKMYAILCDGVGGGANGEIASSLAVESLAAGLNTDYSSEDQALKHLQELFAKSRDLIKVEGRGGSTTAVLVKVIRDEGKDIAVVANIGDSRAYYLSPDGGLEQLSTDDSEINKSTSIPQSEKDRLNKLLDEATDRSELSDQEYLFFRMRNIITQDMTTEPFNIHFNFVEVAPGGKIILTSDGIHDNLTTDEIKALLTTDYAQDLVDKAWSRRQQGVLRSKNDDLTAICLGISTKIEPDKLSESPVEKLRAEVEQYFRDSKEIPEKLKAETDPLKRSGLIDHLLDVNLGHKLEDKITDQVKNEVSGVVLKYQKIASQGKPLEGEKLDKILEQMRDELDGVFKIVGLADKSFPVDEVPIDDYVEQADIIDEVWVFLKLANDLDTIQSEHRARLIDAINSPDDTETIKSIVRLYWNWKYRTTTDDYQQLHEEYLWLKAKFEAKLKVEAERKDTNQPGS